MRWASFFLSLSLLSCGHGPLLPVCVSYPPSNAFVCVDKAGNQYLVPYGESSGYGAFAPDDLRTLLNYCGIKGKQGTEIVRYYNEVLIPEARAFALSQLGTHHDPLP